MRGSSLKIVVVVAGQGGIASHRIASHSSAHLFLACSCAVRSSRVACAARLSSSKHPALLHCTLALRSHRTFPLHLSCTLALCFCLAFYHRATAIIPNRHITTPNLPAREPAFICSRTSCCHLIHTKTSSSKHRPLSPPPLSHPLPRPNTATTTARAHRNTAPRRHLHIAAPSSARRTTACKSASSNFFLEAFCWLQRATRNISLGTRASPRDPRHKPPTPVRHQAR